jgi:hypothetical protein
VTPAQRAEITAKARRCGDVEEARERHDRRKTEGSLINPKPWPGIGHFADCPDCGSTFLVLDEGVDLDAAMGAEEGQC